MRRANTGRDPLLDAVIAKLPARDAGFPAPERIAWITLLCNVLDVVYGVVPHVVAARAIPSVTEPELSKPLDAAPGAKSYAFYVDADGFARGPDGNEILPGEIPRGEILWDLRTRDAGRGYLSSVIWRDGTWPAVTGITLQVPAERA